MSDNKHSESHSKSPETTTGTESNLDAGSHSDDDYLARLGYKSELNRAIGLFSSFAVQFSSIGVISVTYVTLVVGLGYFGPATFWTWLVGGLMQVLFVGLAVAELVSAYPLAGGVYQINSRILSQGKNGSWARWLSWQTGWWIVVAHAVAVASVAYLMVPYIANWLGYESLTIQEQMWWALGLCALSTLCNIAGVRIASLVNNAGVVAELIGGIFIIIALVIGVMWLKDDTPSASILFETAGTVSDGNWLGPLMFSFLLPLFLIQSFDSTGNAAEETVDAARKAPLGVFLANIASLILGTGFILLLFLAIPNLDDVMNSSTPPHLILTELFGPAVTGVFEAIIVIALLANLVVIQLTGARVLWSQARDGKMLFPKVLRKVSVNKVPINATLVTFGMTAVVVVMGSLTPDAYLVLTSMTALAWVLAYGVVVATGMWGLFSNRLPKRPFNSGKFSKVIFPIAAIWSLVGCSLIVASNPAQVGIGMLIVVLLGSIVYFLVPRRYRMADTPLA